MPEYTGRLSLKIIRGGIPTSSMLQKTGSVIDEGYIRCNQLSYADLEVTDYKHNNLFYILTVNGLGGSSTCTSNIIGLNSKKARVTFSSKVTEIGSPQYVIKSCL